MKITPAVLTRNTNSTGSELRTTPDLVKLWKPVHDEFLVYNEDLAIIVDDLAAQLGQSASCSRALLFGAPGLGKTATLAHLAFSCSRPFWLIKPDRLFSSFLGGSASNLTAVFQSAERASAVLVFDDFDALARRRDDPRESGESRRVVTTLLGALDESEHSVPVLAATNLPTAIDPAALRRFDILLPFQPLGTSPTRLLLTQLLESTNVPSNLVALAMGSSPAEIVRIAQRVPTSCPKSDFLIRELTQRSTALSLIGANT
jgi:SpoVK/Ycf46/Vps4 family AAA+-type ATPase